MNEPLDPNRHGDDRPIEYETGHVQPYDDLSAPTSAPASEEQALAALDDRGRRAARGLRVHVEQHLGAAAAGPVPVAAAARGRSAWRSKVAAIAAVAALVVGFAATQGPGSDGDGRLEVDDARRPELATGLLTPLGPRDGKDSIQLPITAEPSTGLRNGDVVTVRGEGFVPGESVGIVQCAREAGGDTPEARGGVDGCYIGDYVNVNADEQGVAEGTYTIKRVLTTPLTGSVDCAAEAGRCIVAMGAISDYDRSGGLAIELDPNVEPVELPTLQVQPTEALADGQAVRVTAAGLTPNEVMYVEVCSADPAACWMTGQPIQVDEQDGSYAAIGLQVDLAGRIDAEVPVWRFLPGGEPGTYVDCTVSRCSLRLSGSTAPPTVPLHFRGDEPPPSAPAFGVEPSTDLAPGDKVVVAGEGFRPGSQLWISLCSTLLTTEEVAGAYGSCGGGGESIEIGDDGAFALEWTVPDPGYLGGEECDAVTGECTSQQGNPALCDGVHDQCQLTVEGDWYGGPDGMASPPIFAPPPVTITFRP